MSIFSTSFWLDVDPRLDTGDPAPPGTVGGWVEVAIAPYASTVIRLSAADVKADPKDGQPRETEVELLIEKHEALQVAHALIKAVEEYDRAQPSVTHPLPLSTLPPDTARTVTHHELDELGGAGTYVDGEVKANLLADALRAAQPHPHPTDAQLERAGES